MRIAAFLLLGALAGCALLAESGRSDPDEVFERAQEALERQDFSSAYQQLSWLYQTRWDRPVGERALLMLAAVELDPRNPGRRLQVGADLADQHDALPAAAPWNKPVGETMYLLATELSAAEDRIARLGRERDIAQEERDAAIESARREAAAAELARAQAASARARANRAATARSGDSPAPTTVALRNEVRQLRATLAEREAELARIQKTLTPN
jgi:hypothetical protein